MNSKNFWLPVIALVGMACLGLGIYSLTNKSQSIADSSQRNISSSSSSVITFPANRSGWQAIGSGSFVLEVKGEINYGGEVANPESSIRIGVDNDLAPGIPVGVLVAKIGENGKPFKVGSVYRFNTSETVYVAINDSYYGDNTGAYTITKR